VVRHCDDCAKHRSRKSRSIMLTSLCVFAHGETHGVIVIDCPNTAHLLSSRESRGRGESWGKIIERLPRAKPRAFARRKAHVARWSVGDLPR